MKSNPSVSNQNISGEKVSVWPGGQGSDGGCTHYIKTLAQVRKNNFSKMENDVSDSGQALALFNRKTFDFFIKGCIESRLGQVRASHHAYAGLVFPNPKCRVFCLAVFCFV